VRSLRRTKRGSSDSEFRKDRSRRKQRDGHGTVAGQSRDKECDGHGTRAGTVTGQGRDNAPQTPKKERVPSVSTKPQARDAHSAGSQESEEIAYFRRGKQLLGENAGGLLSNLRKHKDGNIALARAAIEVASTKENPREYVAKILVGQSAGPPEKGIINARATGII
jgi:hypothetical protein